MASFTSVGDNTTLNLNNKGEVARVAISGTYAMEIALQREKGSKGSGAWETLKSWSVANATVAYDWSAVEDNERLRLIVLVDTSGTATATLEDVSDLALHEWKDPQGNLLMRLTQEGLEVGGAVRRLTTVGGGAPSYSITASVTLTAEDHAGKVGLFTVAGGATVTLPAATGTGNIYRFVVRTTLTSSGIIKVANATDIFVGGVAVSTDAAGVTVLAGATDDTLTMNGSTTGGIKGSWVEFEDVAAGLFRVGGFLVSTGAEATPFSATV